MELINHDGRPYVLRTEITNWFEAKEAEIEKPIHLIYGQGQMQEVYEELDAREIFRFFDWGTRNPEHGVSPQSWVDWGPSSAERFYLSFQNNILRPESGMPDIISSQGGYNYAEIDYMAIWSLMDLSNFNDLEGNQERTNEILTAFYGDLFKKALHKGTFTKRKNEKRKKLQERLSSSLKQRTEQALVRGRENITAIENELAAVHRQNLDYYKRLRRESESLDYKHKRAEQTQEENEKQIKLLMENDMYKDVRLGSNGRNLDVITNELYIYSPNKSERAILGSFRMRLDLETNVLLLHNLSNQRGGRMHPHVPNSGQACWGAMSTPIAKLTADGELIGAFMMAIMYLEKYSPTDDHGRFAGYWFTEIDTEYLHEDGEYRKEKPEAPVEVQTTGGTVSEAEVGL